MDELVGFHVHKGGADQSGFAVLQYTLLTWLAGRYGFGGRFTNNTWTPVLIGERPQEIAIGGQVWIREGALTTGAYGAKVRKNGNDVQCGLGSQGMYPGNVVLVVPTVTDIAYPGDGYQLWLMVADEDCIVDGNPAHTYWSGFRLG